jgi:catechol 2,3-dioxygenase-like lactoylglutathione lyase family enzyme
MPISLDHMTLPVLDTPTSLAFYASVFGGTEGAARGRIVGLWLNEGLELQFRSTEAVQQNHYAFRLEPEEFDAAVGRVKSLGIPYGRSRDDLNGEMLVRSNGQTSVFFRDPNGHDLEMIVRPR